MVSKILIVSATFYNLYLFHLHIQTLVADKGLFALLMTIWGIFLYNILYDFIETKILKPVVFFLPYLCYLHNPKMFFGLFSCFVGFILFTLLFCGLMGKGTLFMFFWLFVLPVSLQYGIFIPFYHSWVENQMYLQIEFILLMLIEFYALYLYFFLKYMLRNIRIVIEKGER